MSDNSVAKKTALAAYFNYQRIKVGNGYPKDSTVGKMIGGNMSGGHSGSRPPMGVEMTELPFLQLVSRVENSLNRLRLANGRAYEYLQLRYEFNCTQKQIADELNCSIRTCSRLHSLVLGFIEC